MQFVKSLALIAGVLLAAGALPEVQAQAWPNKPIKVLSPGAGTGALDTQLRFVFAKLTERTGWQFVFDYRPGADGTIGYDYVSKQPADGYTVLQSFSTMSLLPSTKASLPYDTVKDFTPLTRFINFQNILLVHPSVPAKTLPELVAYTKANPGKIDYATSSRGGWLHLVSLLLARETGLVWNNIPFSAGQSAMPSVLGGHIPVSITVVSEAAELVKAGKIRAIAIVGTRRSPVLPDVPITGDIPGLQDLDVDAWSGLMVRSGTPREIVTRLHAELVTTLNSNEVRDLFLRAGASPVAESMESFSKKFQGDMERWARVVKENKLSF